ncbi:MAG: response regulator transcription factor [Gemmatimonadales bacterium]|nr:response regulator transcription factor [Gemmatimonadales bacterium]
MTGPKATILLVEDEPGLVRTLGDRLRAEGYAVIAVGDGDAAMVDGRAEGADVILLDVMLPGRDGFVVLTELRRRGVTTPVIMVTARDPVEEKIAALQQGADDYVTKPFRTGELLARIEAVLRRARGGALTPDERIVRFGPWVLDLDEGVLDGPAGRATLSNTEFELLAFLVVRRGRAVSREELLREVWRYAPTAVTRTVDQHVAQLRRKLMIVPGSERWIVTVHGRGYLFRGGGTPR